MPTTLIFAQKKQSSPVCILPDWEKNWERAAKSSEPSAECWQCQATLDEMAEQK